LNIYERVDLLSLDAGNTVIFLDHERLSKLARESGINVRADELIVCEGWAKRALSFESKERVVEVEWKDRSAPGARGWGVMMATIFARAGVQIPTLPSLIEHLWESHVAFNLYSKVPEGFSDAMAKLRATGVKVAVVSNSEGMLDSLFEKLGIAESFDAIVDSGKVGVEKPDKRIFEIACERTGTRIEGMLHLGDTIATDIDGARNAGARALLVDPFGHYDGLYPEVPRAVGVVEAARELLERMP
jgi:HAD superfamily hydrolase (TIGR01549 family)